MFSVEVKKGGDKNHFFVFHFFYFQCVMDTRPYELRSASLGTKTEIKQHIKSIVSRAHNTVVVKIDEESDMNSICEFVEILNRVGLENDLIPTLYLNFADNTEPTQERGTSTTINQSQVNLPGVVSQGKLNCLLKIDFLVE